MKLYEIREGLLSSGRRVFTIGQLSVLLGVSREHAKVYAHRLVARGWAWRPRRGIIALTRDEFVLATQLVEPSYVSMHAALYLRGLVDQVPSIVECVTTRCSLALPDLGVRYRRIQPDLFFGYERMDKGESYVMVAGREKALLDMVYFGYKPPSVRADPDVLVKMARRFEKAGGNRARRVVRWVRRIAQQGRSVEVG